MKWSKGTRLGLYAALEMAEAQGRLVTAGGVAEKYGVSVHHLSKVFQQLARAGIAQAVPGVGGGYRLGRSPKDVTLQDVVEVFEGKKGLEHCALSGSHETCGHLSSCRLRRVFDEIEEQALFTLKSIRLSTLLPGGTGPRARTRAAGHPGRRGL